MLFSRFVKLFNVIYQQKKKLRVVFFALEIWQSHYEKNRVESCLLSIEMNLSTLRVRNTANLLSRNQEKAEFVMVLK